MCIVCVAKKQYINNQRLYLFRLLRTCSHLNTSKIQMYNKKYISNTRKCIKYNLFNAKNCGVVCCLCIYLKIHRSLDWKALARMSVSQHISAKCVPSWIFTSHSLAASSIVRN